MVIVDEAAAIPLPLVRNLIGPYLVFLASTINGYEGTGPSLSLKLIQQLRDSTRSLLSNETKEGSAAGPSTKKPEYTAPPKIRTLREVKLDTPIRYGAGDKVEQWLNALLCLDATISPRSALHGTPHPSQCELFYVSRDTLFSYHPASEAFLQRMMALFVVLQVALEGNISKQAILDGLQRGLRAGGDLIPWLVAQQFQEGKFAMMSGARIVRIATHPDYLSVRALDIDVD